MAKIIKKKDCKFENGYVVYKDKVVLADGLEMLNRLEYEIQLANHYLKQPKPAPVPNADDFEFESTFDNKEFEFRNPELEMMHKAEAFEAMLKATELDMKMIGDIANSKLKEYESLVDFVNNKKFLAFESGYTKKIDTKLIGNPLKLTMPKLLASFMLIAKAEAHRAGVEIEDIVMHNIDDEISDELQED